MDNLIKILSTVEWKHGKTTAQYLNNNIQLAEKFGIDDDNCLKSKYALAQHVLITHMFVLNIFDVDVFVEYRKKAKVVNVKFPKYFVERSNNFRAVANIVCMFLEYLDSKIEINWEKTKFSPKYFNEISKNENGKVILKKHFFNNDFPILPLHLDPRYVLHTNNPVHQFP